MTRRLVDPPVGKGRRRLPQQRPSRKVPPTAKAALLLYYYPWITAPSALLTASTHPLQVSIAAPPQGKNTTVRNIITVGACSPPGCCLCCLQCHLLAAQSGQRTPPSSRPDPPPPAGPTEPSFTPVPEPPPQAATWVPELPLPSASAMLSTRLQKRASADALQAAGQCRGSSRLLRDTPARQPSPAARTSWVPEEGLGPGPGWRVQPAGANQKTLAPECEGGRGFRHKAGTQDCLLSRGRGTWTFGQIFLTV